MTRHRPPVGSRDLLPWEVARKQHLEQQWVQVFQRWGYARIIPPTLERLETLTAGGAIDRQTVLQLRDPSGTELGLRPELTASIVRAVASRMTDVALPIRLFYYGSVFQATLQEQERFQAGIELLGAGDWLADAEVVLILAECLKTLALPEWTLILGDVSLTQSLLASLSPGCQQAVKTALANLDRVGLETLPLSDRDRQWALTLFDLRDEPERLWPRLQQLPLAGAARERLLWLQNITALLAQQGVRVTVDLSLIQPFAYYTGLIFKAVAGGEVVGSGGRYDQLHALFSPQKVAQPGMGFCLLIEPILRLLGSDLDPPTTVSDYLVVPQDEATAAVALQVIAQWPHPEQRLSLELLQRSPNEVLAYAKAVGIPEILWVQPDGSYSVTAVEVDKRAGVGT
ncbi:MAG: ATP phosphoribosyltransferase regulatory subunit [Synechococcales cyanobacterium]